MNLARLYRVRRPRRRREHVAHVGHGSHATPARPARRHGERATRDAQSATKRRTDRAPRAPSRSSHDTRTYSSCRWPITTWLHSVPLNSITYLTLFLKYTLTSNKLKKFASLFISKKSKSFSFSLPSTCRYNNPYSLHTGSRSL